MYLTRFRAIALLCCFLPISAVSAAPPTQGKQYIALVDISASRNKDTLDDDRKFLGHVVKELSFGDKMVLMQVQQSGVIDRPKRATVEVPIRKDISFDSPRDKRALASAENGLNLLLPSYFVLPAGTVMLHTDIFSTLQLASEYIRDSGGRRTTLIILSDMLQSANGIEMEGVKRMPPSNWIESEKRNNLIPHLDGACVVVVGADPTTRHGVVVRNFWQKYFVAAGARLGAENYRILPPEADLCN